MKSFREFNLNEGAKPVMLELDWEHGDPNNQGADEWEAEGVFVHTWNPRKNKIIIAGTKPNIHKWLMYTFGLIKRSADIAIRDAKPLMSSQSLRYLSRR